MSHENEITEYQSELWTVRKDDIYAAISALHSGLACARECLTTHDDNPGRTTYKNRTWAEALERDIRKMESALSALRRLPKR